jgi:osmotically-inducible protein OsmY
MAVESPSDPQEVQLEALIQSRIRQMGTDIHVIVNGGQVTLTGTADDFKTKREIDVLVKGIGGVEDVINKLVVASITDGVYENYP